MPLGCHEARGLLLSDLSGGPGSPLAADTLTAEVDGLRRSLEKVTPDIGRPFYRRHNPRRTGLNRSAPRQRGGRFEFFAKVETAGIEPASAVA
jgi:hypothetical protein